MMLNKDKLVAVTKNHTTCRVAIENIVDIMKQIEVSGSDFKPYSDTFKAYILVQKELFHAVNTITFVDADKLEYNDEYQILHGRGLNCSETATIINLLHGTTHRITDRLADYYIQSGSGADWYSGLMSYVQWLVFSNLSDICCNILDIDFMMKYKGRMYESLQ